VMMAIDIDDQEILVAPPHRLLVGMLQHGRGIEFLDRKITKADGIQTISPSFTIRPGAVGGNSPGRAPSQFALHLGVGGESRSWTRGAVFSSRRSAPRRRWRV